MIHTFRWLGKLVDFPGGHFNFLPETNKNIFFLHDVHKLKTNNL